MEYCPKNVTFFQPWINHGLSHCFIDTVASLIIFCHIIICGGIQSRIYRKYSTDLDCRLLPKAFTFKVQVAFHIIFPVLSLIRLIFQATFFDGRVVYGYMVLTVCLSVVLWPFALYVLLLERQKALPSVPTRGHGLVLLVFWTLVFVNENLTFLNMKNESWFFKLNSLSDKLNFSMFVVRYFSAMCMFVIGLRAPGIPSPQDYFVYRQLQLPVRHTPVLEEGRNSPVPPERSTFVNFWQKLCQLGPFMWPKKNVALQLRVIFCFMLLVLGRVVNIYVPIYSKNIVNSLNKDLKTITFRWDYILIYISLWFLQGQGNNSFLSNIRSFLWIRVQQYTVKAVQLDLYKHLHSLSLRWHLNRKIGEVLRVMDRGTSSVTSLLSYIVFSILPTCADVIIAVLYFALAFNIWFGVIVFVTMALYLGATISVTEWRTKHRRRMNKLDNAVEATGLDSLLNFETVKYYCAEDYELRNYEKAVDQFQEAEWITTATLNLLNTMQNSVITIGILAGSLLCAHMVVTGDQLTVGDYVLFSTYIMQLYTPLNYFGTYYRMIQTAFIDMENMFDLLKEKPEVNDDPNAVPLLVKSGTIEFQNVNFSYIPERQILKDLSFTVPAGHTVALVGPTGSGKSTIIRLLFRLYDVHSGEILIDGQNIAKVTQESLRRHIGVVPQDTVLFNKDIRYNIRYGRVTASDDEVEDAAKAADIHGQILSFPDAYDTIVGERGLKLSGGEKQRVAIARTILKTPAFVILDEATSSLDTQTERNIQSSFANICANRTTVIIAHRLSTIIHADQILVIKDGEIIERGRHEELLERGEVYANMWNQQLRNDDLNSDSEKENEVL